MILYSTPTRHMAVGSHRAILTFPFVHFDLILFSSIGLRVRDRLFSRSVGRSIRLSLHQKVRPQLKQNISSFRFSAPAHLSAT